MVHVCPTLTGCIAPITSCQPGSSQLCSMCVGRGSDRHVVKQKARGQKRNTTFNNKHKAVALTAFTSRPNGRFWCDVKTRSEVTSFGEVVFIPASRGSYHLKQRGTVRLVRAASSLQTPEIGFYVEFAHKPKLVPW